MMVNLLGARSISAFAFMFYELNGTQHYFYSNGAGRKKTKALDCLSQTNDDGGGVINIKKGFFAKV